MRILSVANTEAALLLHGGGAGPHRSSLPSKPACLENSAIYPGPISGAIKTELFTPKNNKQQVKGKGVYATVTPISFDLCGLSQYVTTTL